MTQGGPNVQEFCTALREELQRFAAETLKHELAEFGESMRQGVQDDLASFFSNPRNTGSGYYMSDLSSLGVDRDTKLFEMNNAKTGAFDPTASQTSLPAFLSQGDASMCSDSHHAPKVEAQDLAWTSRPKKSFNAKRELNVTQKRRSLSKRISSRMSGKGSAGGKAFAALAEFQKQHAGHGSDHDEAEYCSNQADSNGDPDQFVNSERAPGDLTPAMAIEETPSPPSDLPMFLPTSTPAVSADQRGQVHPERTSMASQARGSEVSRFTSFATDPAMQGSTDTEFQQKMSNRKSIALRGKTYRTYLAKKEMGNRKLQATDTREQVEHEKDFNSHNLATSTDPSLPGDYEQCLHYLLKLEKVHELLQAQASESYVAEESLAGLIACSARRLEDTRMHLQSLRAASVSVS